VEQNTFIKYVFKTVLTTILVFKIAITVFRNSQVDLDE